MTLSGFTDMKVPLMAGAFAGLSVDIALFPIDTIKTRLQSELGFIKSGGFRNIYSGLGSTVVGSSPGAAIFFCSYETIKSFVLPHISQKYEHILHMSAAALGDVASCIVRVPTEVVKQKAQASANISSWMVFKRIIHSEGITGFYRGYKSTIFREIPFSVIQLPLWEYLKSTVSKLQGYPVNPWQAAICGGVAGGVAAALTNPIDVVKTRIMLANKNSSIAKGYILPTFRHIWRTSGIKGLFSGCAVRVLWISLGGVIFFGAYETARKFLLHRQNAHQ